MLALHHCRIFSFFAALLLVPLYISAGPVVTEITPYFGPSDGGTTVLITGSGFTGATSVSFGNTTTVPTVISDSLIRVTTPAHTSQVVGVTVTGQSQTSSVSNKSHFVYQGTWIQAGVGIGISDNPVTFVAATPTPEVIHEAGVGNNEIASMAFTPDGTQLYCLPYPNTYAPIYVFDVASGTVLTTIETGGSPNSLVFHPNGLTAYAIDVTNNALYVISTSDYTITGVALGNNPYQAAITLDGATLFISNSGTGANFISVVNTSNLSVSNFPLDSDVRASSLAVSPDGRTLYAVTYNSASTAGNLTVIDIASLTLISTVNLPNDTGYDHASLAISPNGAYVFVTTGNLTTLTAISTSNLSDVTNISFPTGFTGANAIVVTPDSSRVYIPSYAGTNSSPVAYFSVENLTAEGSTELVGANYLNSLCVTPDGSQIYIAPYEESIDGDGGALAMLYNSDPSGPYLMIPTGTPQIINGMAADQAPLARFQAVQGVGGLVEFDASESISPVGTIVSYAWNFGDGSVPSLTDSPTISHVYSTAGSYTVTLTVTNSAGTSTTQIYNTASYWNGYVIFNPGILLNGGPTAQLEQAVIVSPPIVTSVSPKKGSCQSDEEVKIEGTGFLGAIAVFFGDERATNFTIVSDTLIKAEVPKGCGKVAVTVQSLVGTSPGTVFYKYIPKEPRDANGFQDFNILKQQFDNVIVWEAPYKPHSNGKKKCCKITSYQIYSDPKLNDLIGEVSSKSCKNDCVAYEYVDKNVKEGKTYTYYIVSVDSSGHKSDPAVVKVKPIKVGLPCDRFLPGKKPFIR